MSKYYMVRYATQIIYTFEFVVSLLVLVFVLYLYLKDIDKNSLWAFLIMSALHSVTELIAQGVGVRIIKKAYLFNIPIQYPITPIIIGFFEGGVIGLGAYHFVRAVLNKGPLSIKFVIITSIFFVGILLLGSFYMRMQINSNLSDVTLTRREMFTPNSIILLIIMFSIPLLYCALSKKIDTKGRISFLYWYLGLILYSLFIILPTHLLQIRYIAVAKNSSFLPVSLFEQIIVMYGLSVLIEATGFLIHFYVIIYHFDLIEI